jgi:small subunit ribosomal protein S16
VAVAVDSWVASEEIGVEYIFQESFPAQGSPVPGRPIFTKEKTLAVVIRLTRRGAKKKPFYRIVAADSRMPRDGRFLEILGTYDPMVEENGFKVDADKAMAWIKKGAKPSKTVGSLFKKAGVGV